MGERRGLYRVLVGKPEGKNHLEDPGVDGRIILRWNLRAWVVGVWTTYTVHKTEIHALLDTTTHLFEASSLAATPSRKRRMSSLLFMAASSLGVW